MLEMLYIIYYVIKGKYGEWIPMLVFGSFSVAAGLLALAFPETKNCQLPETIEEGEAFGLK